MENNEQEITRQNKCSWARSIDYNTYNEVLGNYQVLSCLENSHGKNALDLACGDGLLTSMFSNKFERIVAVDASKAQLLKAKSRELSNVVFIESLIEDLNLTEKFDTIFMLNILEHVINPTDILKKVTDFLKDDGILIIHVPNAKAINRKIAVLMGTLTSCDELSPFDINIAGHRRSYTMNTLKADIKKAALKVVKTGGIFYKMLSTPQMDWFLRNGLWDQGDFGWGRVGGDKKDWRREFCRACYEIGKEYPEDCNIIYACVSKGGTFIEQDSKRIEQY